MKRYSIYKNKILKDNRSKKLNFKSDGRFHYVYRVTDLIRNNEKNYYGSRTSTIANIFQDFWSYKTSSKYNILNENKKENYKIKIIKVFDNPGDKILYESFLHQYFDVKNNNNFWNKSNQTPFGFDTTGVDYGGRITNDGIKKMIKSKNKIFIKDGKKTTSAIETAKKAAESMKKIGLDGLTTYQKNAEKRLKTELNKIMFEGNLLSIREIKTIKRNKTMGKQGKKIAKERSMSSYMKNTKKYNIMKNKKIILQNVIRKDIDKLSPTLRLSSLNKPLGSSRQSVKSLELNNKTFLFGLYCEEIVSEEYFEGDILKELNKLL